MVEPIWRARRLAWLTGALCLLSEGIAHAEEYAVAAGGIAVTAPDGTHVVAIPDCDVKVLTSDGDRIFAVCAKGDRVELDISDPRTPKAASRIPATPPPVAEPPPTPPPSAPPEEKLKLDGRRPGFSVAGEVRPFVVVGGLGVGVLSTASLTYRASLPIAIHFEMSPFGVGVDSPSNLGTIVTGSAGAIVSLDVPLFELGFGVGGASQNDGPTTKLATAIPGLMRIGSRDGISFTMRTNHVRGAQGFQLDSTDLTLQAPMTERWWLLVRGGGGSVGYGFGDVGVRYLLRGDLGPGSLLVTGIAGCDGVFTNGDPYVGPSLGAGFEWRL